MKKSSMKQRLHSNVNERTTKMKQFTDEEKAKMLEKINELDIDITMYRKATNVLDLSLENEDAVEGFIDDPTSPINYDFIEDQYEETGL